MHIAVVQLASPLRELTCYIGLHSVTCHPAEVTFQPNRAQCRVTLFMQRTMLPPCQAANTGKRHKLSAQTIHNVEIQSDKNFTFHQHQ